MAYLGTLRDILVCHPDELKTWFTVSSGKDYCFINCAV